MCVRFPVALPDHFHPILTDLYRLNQFAPLSSGFHLGLAYRRHWKEIWRVEGVRLVYLFTQSLFCRASHLLYSTWIHSFFWVSLLKTYRYSPFQVPVAVLALSDPGLIIVPNYFSHGCFIITCWFPSLCPPFLKISPLKFLYTISW